MRTLLLVVALAGAGMWMAPAAAQEGLMAESPVDDEKAIDEAAAEEAAGDEQDDEAIAETALEETGAGANPAVRAAAEENAEPVAPLDDEAPAEPRSGLDGEALGEPSAAASDAPSADSDAAPAATGTAAPRVVLETLTITEDTPSQVELTFSARAQRPTAKAIGGEAGKPERIVVDFPSTKLAKSVPPSSPGRGRVLQVRAGQYKPDVTRVVLELAEPWPTRVRLKNDKVVIQLEDSSSASAR